MKPINTNLLLKDQIKSNLEYSPSLNQFIYTGDKSIFVGHRLNETYMSVVMRLNTILRKRQAREEEKYNFLESINYKF